MLSALTKPQYVFRPWQAGRRLLQRSRRGASRAVIETSTLPWGLPLTYRPSEHIGEFLHHHGVYDLCVTEAIWRLLDPGDSCLDVGANIGYTSSVMARRVGPDGVIHAFEPHPDVFAELTANVASWEDWGVHNVERHRIALSDADESGTLVNQVFEHNSGIGFVGTADASSDVTTHEIALRRLDAMVLDGAPFGLMKLDVEGHEAAVLRGAEASLAAGQVRDIVFEDHDPMPSPVAELLAGHGYTILRLRQRLLGLVATSLDEPPRGNLEGPPNYVATRDPQRARARLGRVGWESLRRHSPSAARVN